MMIRVQFPALWWRRQGATSLCGLLVCLALTGCEPGLNARLQATDPVDTSDFDQAQGMEIPYPLYLPSSLTAWSLDESTRFRFDAQRKLYLLEGIPLNLPLIDSLGPRFKLCSESWQYQFGFGSYITDDESTVGVSEQPAVVRVERFPQASTDIRLEFSAPAGSEHRYLRVEFKLLHWEPKPEGLLRLSLYQAQPAATAGHIGQ